MTSDPERSPGLRPKIGSACRAFLRAATPDSEAHCPACGVHLAFQSRIGASLRLAPRPPSDLHSVDFIAGIYERLDTSRDASNLTAAMRTPEAPDWVAQMTPPALEPTVAAAALGSPIRAELGSWAAVHRAILSDAQSAAPSHRHPLRTVGPRWMVGLAAAAAVAVGGALLTKTTERPTIIVFTDLDAAPGIDFTLLRLGVQR